jgi:hypothetical protein
MGTEDITPGVKRPRREADQTLSSKAEVNNTPRLYIVVLNHISAGTTLSFFFIVPMNLKNVEKAN